MQDPDLLPDKGDVFLVDRAITKQVIKVFNFIVNIYIYIYSYVASYMYACNYASIQYIIAAVFPTMYRMVTANI